MLYNNTNYYAHLFFLAITLCLVIYYLFTNIKIKLMLFDIQRSNKLCLKIKKLQFIYISINIIFLDFFVKLEVRQVNLGKKVKNI